MRITLTKDATEYPERRAELALLLLTAAEAVGACIDTIEASGSVAPTERLLRLHDMQNQLAAAASSLEFPLYRAMHPDEELFELNSVADTEAALAAAHGREGAA